MPMPRYPATSLVRFSSKALPVSIVIFTECFLCIVFFFGFFLQYHEWLDECQPASVIELLDTV